MPRYKYQQLLRPPAPFVHVALRNPLSSVELREVAAQLDTAADRTLLPSSLVQALGLPKIGRIAVGGVGGTVQKMPTYPVLLAIHGLGERSIAVVADEEEPWVILGRDVLNAHRILLDGPKLALEID